MVRGAGLGLRAVSPLHVAAYIRTHPGSAPTVKQHLAAIRMLGDWLVVSQGYPGEPAYKRSVFDICSEHARKADWAEFVPAMSQISAGRRARGRATLAPARPRARRLGRGGTRFGSPIVPVRGAALGQIATAKVIGRKMAVIAF